MYAIRRGNLASPAYCSFLRFKCYEEGEGIRFCLPNQSSGLAGSCKVVTYQRVRWAIDSFAPYKSTGMDGIFPALLQEGCLG